MMKDNSIVLRMTRHPEGNFEIHGVGYRPEWLDEGGNMSGDDVKAVIKQVVNAVEGARSEWNDYPREVYVHVVGDRTRVAMFE